MSAPPALPLTAGELLTLDELRDLRRLSSLRGVGLVLHAWGITIGAMILYASCPSALTLVAAIMLIGGRQMGLIALMHEAAHWRLSPDPRINDVVARWLCAYPMWADLRGYRRRHHLHHRHTLQPDDPDAASFTSPHAFSRELLRDLGAVSALRQVIGWAGWRGRAGETWRRLRGPLTANALLWAVLAVAGHGHLYVILWLLPMATWHQLVNRIRTIAEHGLVADRDDALRNTRTVGAGLAARIFIAPYWMNYHLEHHLLVFVPCWSLRRAHALLLAKGHGSRMELISSYGSLIRRLIASR